MMNLSIAIAHFLNCFLYSGQVPNPLQGTDEVSLYKVNVKDFFNVNGGTRKMCIG
jgi:hypothetical protein